ncbi:hypothetical protein [Streptomyces johnsoniae]|uniref:Uncharacterized protein n=1 Tax=Streptomyces johnsoniae TaxID=3075532 RepID=A0ABU2RY56_9ACTN|nr:hypothetical protein [Streptomyces sp. DSM 41886]MDT0441423.1 hypothetical protein [Streptomyces sp. DSM 41886]
MWLHQLLVLWLMDTVNVLSTYLSAPASLPLPPQAARLVQRAVEVSNLAESVSADLVTGAEPHQAWERMIDRAAAMAS